MISAASFLTRSLRESHHGMRICRILAAAVNAVDPYAAVRSAIQFDGRQMITDGASYDLEKYGRILILGIGKACVPMLRAVRDVLGGRIDSGIGITKDGYASAGEIAEFREDNIDIRFAGHPIPDERSIQAARNVSLLLKNGHKDDLILVVISGGGSALFSAPISGVSLSDFRDLNRSLIMSGATIHEINTVRKHIDEVKGGGLARLACPATVVTFILSDVVGDALDVIASGPTVPDHSTFEDAGEILRRVSSQYPIPKSIYQQVKDGAAGKLIENPRPGEDIFENVRNVLVGSNRIAACEALEQARREGFSTSLLTTFLQGEARGAGLFLGAIARESAVSGQPLQRPACIVAGGETTVTVHGDGLGGRNQELALGAVDILDGLAETFLISLATDGGDGNSDAAGAVVTGETLRRAANLGLNVKDYLQRNDSYDFFQALDDLLRPGPTQTNVNDLAFIIAP